MEETLSTKQFPCLAAHCWAANARCCFEQSRAVPVTLVAGTRRLASQLVHHFPYCKPLGSREFIFTWTAQGIHAPCRLLWPPGKGLTRPLAATLCESRPPLFAADQRPRARNPGKWKCTAGHQPFTKEHVVHLRMGGPRLRPIGQVWLSLLQEFISRNGSLILRNPIGLYRDRATNKKKVHCTRNSSRRQIPGTSFAEGAASGRSSGRGTHVTEPPYYFGFAACSYVVWRNDMTI